jgi:hypothetical protein
MRAVAGTLLEQTGYANTNSTEVALCWQFTRRGWPLRTRAEAVELRRAPKTDDPARAA